MYDIFVYTVHFRIVGLNQKLSLWLESWTLKEVDHPVLGRRLFFKLHLNELSSCLNECAWPRFQHVSSVLSMLHLRRIHGKGFALRPPANVSGHPETDLFLVCHTGNETGSGMQVCDRICPGQHFYFGGGVCVLPHLVTWRWKQVFVPKGMKHRWMYTWWNIAINVKYASAANVGLMSLHFMNGSWSLSHIGALLHSFFPLSFLHCPTLYPLSEWQLVWVAGY